MKNFKKDINSKTLMLGDFNTAVSTMDKSSKQRINKEILALNNILYQTDLIDMQRLLPPQNKIYILFKCTWNIYKDRPHGRTQNKPQIFMKIEIISSIVGEVEAV